MSGDKKMTQRCMSFFSLGECYRMSFRAILPKRFTPEPAQEPASRIVASVASAPPPSDVASRKHVIIPGTRFHTFSPCYSPEGS